VTIASQLEEAYGRASGIKSVMKRDEKDRPIKLRVTKDTNEGSGTRTDHAAGLTSAA